MHVRKFHHQNLLELEQGMATLPLTMVNASIQIPILKPTSGLKCNQCGCISKNKNLASFKQWHHGSSPSCKHAPATAIQIQIRCDEAFEYVPSSETTPKSFLQTISTAYHDQLIRVNPVEDLYTSNPLQVYFNVFTVFGRNIKPEDVNDYKNSWDAAQTRLVNEGFSNFFIEKGNILSYCDVI